METQKQSMPIDFKNIQSMNQDINPDGEVICTGKPILFLKNDKK